MESSAHHEPDPHRWQALTLVCVAMFMTVLDVSIVNVALPSIRTALNVSDKNLQWVITAYAITFGGFLLLGGRAADLLGRRRMFMIGIALFSLTLYVQQVLHYSALKTGLTFLATAGTVIPVAGTSQALTTRFGPRPVMSLGLALITGGMVWYSQIPVHGSFASDLLPGYLMVGVGMAFAFIPMSIAALAGVAPHEAGLASGLINTSQQIGGAVGVAVASTVAFTHMKTLLASHHDLATSLTSGFGLAFWVFAAIGAASVLACLTLVRSQKIVLEGEPVEAY
jgi:MFS family permease